ncbi:MAG: hypothetical protein Q9194_007364, partial [Teloschistes cf. exilis]
NCTRVVLESESKHKPILLHRVSADREQAEGLFSWDLAMFRYPRRPEYQKIKAVEKTKYLDLDFGSVAGKNTSPPFVTPQMAAPQRKVPANEMVACSKGRVYFGAQRSGECKEYRSQSLRETTRRATATGKGENEVVMKGCFRLVCHDVDLVCKNSGDFRDIFAYSGGECSLFTVMIV